MSKTIVLCVLGLVGVASAPAIFHTSNRYWKASSASNNSTTPAVTASVQNGTPSTANALAPLPPIPPSVRWEGETPTGLNEVLRFDVSIEWILRRWPRVSTGLAHLQLQGYRVPLITGTAHSDLAGSLTYYFNPKQQVERITFRGKTGDPRSLVALLTTQYKFTFRPVNNPGLFVYESVSPSGQPKGLLKIHSASVIKAIAPYERFDLELIMERPSDSG